MLALKRRRNIQTSEGRFQSVWQQEYWGRSCTNINQTCPLILCKSSICNLPLHMWSPPLVIIQTVSGKTWCVKRHTLLCHNSPKPERVCNCHTTVWPGFAAEAAFFWFRVAADFNYMLNVHWWHFQMANGQTAGADGMLILWCGPGWADVHPERALARSLTRLLVWLQSERHAAAP